MDRARISTLLDMSERRIFQRLSSPRKIQDFLDSLTINFEPDGETYMSPRRVLKHMTAHCFEGALLAAAALLYHHQKAFLLDLRTVAKDEDHVVTLFLQNNQWGAISKTNHGI